MSCDIFLLTLEGFSIFEFEKKKFLTVILNEEGNSDVHLGTSSVAKIYFQYNLTKKFNKVNILKLDFVLIFCGIPYI